MPFTTVHAIYNDYKKVNDIECIQYNKKNVNGPNRVVGVVLLYRTGMLAVTGSDHGYSLVCVLLAFCFLFLSFFFF